MCQTFAEVEAQHWRRVSEEWEREKEKILGSLLGGGQELASLPSSVEVEFTTCLSAAVGSV